MEFSLEIVFRWKFLFHTSVSRTDNNQPHNSSCTTEEKSLVVLEQAGVIRLTSYRGKEQLQVLIVGAGHVAHLEC